MHSAETILFGGSFDPVHNGHLAIARTVAKALGATKVVLLPAGANPLKPAPGASNQDRLAMLQLATQDDPLFLVSDIELQRTPPTYTIDTIETLFEKDTPDEKPRFLIGADSLQDLPRWHRLSDLVDHVRFVVACRPPQTRDAVEAYIESIRHDLPKQADLCAVETDLIDIASSTIRQRVAAGQPITEFVPPAVAAYIQTHSLYAPTHP